MIESSTTRRWRLGWVAVAATLVAGSGLAASGSPDQVAAGPGPGSTTTVAPSPGPLTGSVHVTAPSTDRCDPLGDGCLLPFPSDFYTQADPGTDTGRRVHLEAASLPANVNGVRVDPTHWNELDGFSPAAAVLFQLPGLDLTATGAAPVTDVAASLAADAPVVLLDATTRRRLPNWTELDAAAEAGSVPTAYIRPAVILPEGHRIVVGLRRLRAADRSLLAPSDVFRAYRDRRRTDDANVEARRPAMERVFADLDRARVARRDLVLAWDFTVASQRALSERLLHLRDDGFARLGGDAPAFTITADVASTRTGIAREITGTYQVPRYLSGTGAPGLAGWPAIVTTRALCSRTVPLTALTSVGSCTREPAFSRSLATAWVLANRTRPSRDSHNIPVCRFSSSSDSVACILSTPYPHCNHF